MEKYNDFLDRISYQQAELQIGEGNFTPDDRVYQKVNADNSFKPFYGDTIVFALGSKTKKKIGEMIDVLYDSVPECFCEKLREDTLHMTLHDLSASDNLESVSSELFYNELHLLQYLREEPCKSQTIAMKMNYIVNMVDTSLVMALVPADKSEWNKLQKLYTFINKVKVCPYPYLTPHITLAYFNYNGFDITLVEKLKKVIKDLNTKKLDITLHTDKLFYQKFVSMNEYINVFGLT